MIQLLNHLSHRVEQRKPLNQHFKSTPPLFGACYAVERVFLTPSVVSEYYKFKR